MHIPVYEYRYRYNYVSTYLYIAIKLKDGSFVYKYWTPSPPKFKKIKENDAIWHQHEIIYIITQTQ